MLVWAGIAPHGGDIIEELAPDTGLMATTRAAMEELGRRCRAACPDTVVVYTPHGLCVGDAISISVARHAMGKLDGETGRSVAARLKVDNELAEAIGEEASAAGTPAVLAAYAETNTPTPVFPLDWGALIPLWFLGARWPVSPSIVVACPDRALPRRALVAFGAATVAAARRVGRRIAVVASADLGHGHRPDGPYGYSAGSASHDRAFCRAVRQDELGRLLRWQERHIEAAQTDAFWQTLMLFGALQGAGLRPELLSYEAPTYFGMACASFDPAR